VVIVSAGLRAGSLRPDLTTIALHDVEPSHVVLAARAGDRSRLVAAFRLCAQARLAGPESHLPALTRPQWDSRDT
jgi:hypothetical protein